MACALTVFITALTRDVRTESAAKFADADRKYTKPDGNYGCYFAFTQKARL